MKSCIKKLDKKHQMQRLMSGFRGLCWYAREYVVILAIFAKPSTRSHKVVSPKASLLLITPGPAKAINKK
jgi:hypothetical protein